MNLTFATAPPGLTLYVDGIARTTPFVYDTLVGFTHTVEARNQSTAGTTYTFGSWSDGGQQEHSIVVPTVDRTYTATYDVAVTPATPAFVQVNSATPQTDQTTVAVPYPSAQTGGNTNIVVVGLNNTTSNIVSVTDTAGNTYEVAAPLARGTGISQAIYYAKNIRPAVGGCQRRDRHARPADALRGLPCHGVRGAGSCRTVRRDIVAGRERHRGDERQRDDECCRSRSSSGPARPRACFTGAAAGFTTRIITPIDADIVVDRNVASAGVYSAGAVQGGPRELGYAGCRVPSRRPVTADVEDHAW